MLVSALVLILSVPLAVGDALGRDRPAMTGKVAGTGKTFDVPNLHGEGRPQNDSHPRQGRHLGIGWQRPSTGHDDFLNFLDALGQLLDVLDLHAVDELVRRMNVAFLILFYLLL